MQSPRKWRNWLFSTNHKVGTQVGTMDNKSAEFRHFLTFFTKWARAQSHNGFLRFFKPLQAKSSPIQVGNDNNSLTSTQRARNGAFARFLSRYIPENPRKSQVDLMMNYCRLTHQHPAAILRLFLFVRQCSHSLRRAPVCQIKGRLRSWKSLHPSNPTNTTASATLRRSDTTAFAAKLSSGQPSAMLFMIT